MAPRIGFYICHCGINISYRVRVEEVAAFAGQLENVVVARDYRFMCSDPGQEMIEKDIHDFHLNRVVVASCSPRLHEKTFQAACSRAGLNPYYFQMASVREQVSWVTENEDDATRKAKTLAAAAINRVNFHESLAKRSVSIHPDSLIVGAGIAGMQAALDIGNSGNKVYLVERETTIGGHMLQFDKTFPTLDCAACIGTPKMVEVAQNPNIALFSYSEVEEVSGYIGNFMVRIRKKPRYIKEGVCTGCGECTKVCPVEVPGEWDAGIGTRKAIYRSFPQAVPITFCIDKRDRAPCVTACPAHVNVQGYVQLIKMGRFREAVQLIMEKLPFPGVLGRVCPHPCETLCRRKDVDDAVAIRDLKRFAADQVDMDSLPVPDIAGKGKKAAVVGSGPAGLTVAYDLRLFGYEVTVFEAQDQPGGMLRTGIPHYRLPREILDREIRYIERLGVTIRTGVRFGKDITFSDLEDQGYETIFMGIGAQDCMKLDIPGEDGTQGVMDAISFLHKTSLGITAKPGDNVVVIGGGNVAIDSVRVAKRLKAQEVTLVYRRSEAEMPAFLEEIHAAKEEGIDFHFLTTPLQILTEAGKVTGIRCIRNIPGEPDSGGRRRPEPVAGSEFDIPCDAVITAIGQKILPCWGEDQCVLVCDPRSRLEVDPETMQTSMKHVFAGGDVVTGPATVVEAVAAGHRAAKGMMRYMEGLPMEKTPPEPEETTCAWPDIPESCQTRQRACLTHIDPEIRVNDFSEESISFTQDQAMEEANRCLNCGVCSECMACVSVCEAKAIDHSMKEEIVEVKVGNIILATGYDLMDARSLHQYGWGVYPNVFTSLEFERLSNATGPTGGKILMREQDGQFLRAPKSVALLHCIGSRDVNHHEYCSRVCCMYALKYSHLIKEKVGHDTKVYDFYIDMRCFGEGYEEFYRRCQEEGTIFIRGKVAEITDIPKTSAEEGKLVCIAEDTLLGRPVRVPVDMAVLCMAMETRHDASLVGRIFGVNQGADGFFLEEHPKLGPLNTASDGVFLAGACQSPKDIPDTVAQASGAAAKVLSLASRGEVDVPSVISFIDPDICSGCKTCIGLCPYSAIGFDERRGVSVVNEAMCKGCGSCAGFCPSGAAQVLHFRPKQVFAEFEGIMQAISDMGI